MNDPSAPRPMTPPRRLLTRRVLLQTGTGLTAAMAGSLGGRAAAQDERPVATPAASPDAAGRVTPERVARAAERVPALARQILEQTGVPGMSVAVVHGDAVAFLGGFGVRQLRGDAAVDADTVFQLASVSKPVAATVVSTIVGDGTVEWTSRMADVDPGFALRDSWTTQAVTLADLFAHRSGLRDHAGDLLEDLGFDRDAVIHRLRYLEPEYSFRAGYAYTNFGLTAAAVAAAKAAGTSWENLSAERLYAPLGMAHTSSRFADYMAEANRAIPHVKDGATWKVTPMQRDPDAQSPAGGVSSTARDLARWVRLQLGQGMVDGVRLIPAAALAPTHVPQSVMQLPQDPATQRAEFYGLGMNVSYTDFGTVQWSHSGAFESGAATAIYLLPGAGFGVLALTNGAPVGAPEALCLSVLDLAQRGEVTRDWLAAVAPVFAAIDAPPYGTGTNWDAPPPGAMPALPDNAYLGTYRNDFYGDVVVVQAGGGLALRIGPKPLEFPLAHYHRDTFSWQPTGENAAGRSGLSFTISPDGTASAFRDEYLASGGAGVLTRAERPAR
jgi:CubicO group peptidase (beta-lactamase class C family)